MIKTFPTPGHQYRVIEGDSQKTVEERAYGYESFNLEQANPFLSAHNLNPDGRRFLYPNDIIDIPLIKKSVSDTLPGKENDEFTLIIAGREIETTTKKLLRTMDTPSDGWTASIQWVPGADEELDKLLKPFSYPDAQFYVGGKLKCNGFLYIVSPTIGDNGLTVSLEGFSSTKNAIDSTMPTPYEQSKVSLKDRANQLLTPFGISADFNVDEDDELFDRVTADITAKCGDHITSLARQRGYLCSSSVDGDWLFTKYEESAPMDTIVSGDSLPVGWGAEFDGTGVFSKITVIGESPGSVSNNISVQDDELPKARFTASKADESNSGNLEKAAAWQRTQQYADSLTIPFPVNSIFTSKGELWEEGRTVTVVSPEIFCPDGFTFLIRSVEYTEEDGGKTAVLNLVPPSLFSGGDIILPWR